MQSNLRTNRVQHNKSEESQVKSGWWFQPIWKILVKLEIFPKVRGEHKKWLLNHHLEIFSPSHLGVSLASNFDCRVFCTTCDGAPRSKPAIDRWSAGPIDGTNKVKSNSISEVVKPIHNLLVWFRGIFEGSVVTFEESDLRIDFFRYFVSHMLFARSDVMTWVSTFVIPTTCVTGFLGFKEHRVYQQLSSQSRLMNKKCWWTVCSWTERHVVDLGEWTDLWILVKWWR